ncbi:hypothetical protein [Thioalkalivibrio sulfidiphilus]|uniref:hypothetical protein n=1 Tax=Thioalkalivibrio sulfidiphilus TaxID=1033854 RepID=UPI00036BCB12|nr:hypothetical protein [Thioalkalivibrio sulfidiphilus]
MEFDLQRIFEDGYPGLAISAKIGSVEDYLNAVIEFLPVIQDQSMIRFKARLEKDYPGLSENDLAEEYETHDWTVNGLIPSLLGGSVLVATWAAFEEGAAQVCSYVKSQESCPLSLDGLREQNQKKRIELYLKLVAGKEVRLDQNLNEIRIVRNVFAHSNGNIGALSSNRLHSIKTIVEKTSDIELRDNQLVLGLPYLERALSMVKENLAVLLSLIHEAYPWNMRKPDS